MSQTRISIANFGRNVTLTPSTLHRPASEEELLEILRRSQGQNIRAVGKLHCWSQAVDVDDVLILTEKLNSISIDKTGGEPTVTVGGGCQIKDLLNELSKHGLTLPSVGLIDKQTIAGATATGTHGSGKHSLSHYIVAARVAHFDENGQPIVTTVDCGVELQALRCSLGLLGILVSLTLQCRPSYQICEHAAKYDSIEEVLEQESEFPLQQFYLMPWSWKYFAHHRVETPAPKSKLNHLYRFYCFTVIDVSLHVVVYLLSKLARAGVLARFFYKWIIGLTIPRNWRVVDDARKMLVMQHDLFGHIEIEIFVTRSQLTEATQFLTRALSVFGGLPDPVPDASTDLDLEAQPSSYVHRYPICFRRILPDDTLISMCSPNKNAPDEDWFAISLISYEWPSQRKGFYEMADFLAHQMLQRFAARCHWGKHNPLVVGDNYQLYPHLEQFNSIRKKFDPHGRFSNRWLADVLDANISAAEIKDVSHGSAPRVD